MVGEDREPTEPRQRWRRIADHLTVSVGWCAVSNLGLGLFFLSEGKGRTRSQTYADLRSVMPTYAWGIMFLCFGLALLVVQALFRRWRQVELRILVALIGLFGWFWWGLFLLLSAEPSDGAAAGSYSAFWAAVMIFSAHLIVAIRGE